MKLLNTLLNISLDESNEKMVHDDIVTIGEVAKPLEAPLDKKGSDLDEVIGEFNESIKIFKGIIN